jgi:hypothetical protein
MSGNTIQSPSTVNINFGNLFLSAPLLLKKYRHIQYCYLADGSLWDVVGWVSVRRTVEPAVKLAAADVRVLPATGLTKEQEDRIAEAMATGWRPLAPGKEPGCAQCGGRGICPFCLGSGDPGVEE